jgi:IS605 OrfB family transposase
LYQTRQYFFSTSKYLGYNKLRRNLQDEKTPSYYALNTKVSQMILRQIDNDFSSFFQARKAWLRDPEPFLGRPSPPGYKEKDGRAIALFNFQNVGKKALRLGILQLSGLLLSLPLQHEVKLLGKQRFFKKVKKDYETCSLKQVIISPYGDGFNVLIQHEVSKPKKMEDLGLKAGIDLGVNNLAAVVSNKKELKPFLINGRPLKSINQFFNKTKASLQSELDLAGTRTKKRRIRRRITKLERKRNHKVNDYLHKASRKVVNQVAETGISHLVVGQNIGWKQEITLGKRGNQSFVLIPHAKFIEFLRYKWEAIGGTLIPREESYTSKCSFLDQESIEKHDKYMGKRVKRGLFRTSEGYLMNSDTNGASNILVKEAGGSFDSWSKDDLVEGFVVNPVDLTIPRFSSNENLTIV